MHVWIIQTGEPLHSDTGSPRPMRAMNLANALISRGHSVVIWSSGFYHQEKRHRTLAYKEIQISNQLKICLIPSPGYKRNIGIGRLIDHYVLSRNLKEILISYRSETPDVAFVGYPPIEVSTVAIDWLSIHNVPTVIDVKDLWPSLFLEPFPKPIRPLVKMALWPYYKMARRTLKSASAFSSMSQSYLEWMSSFSGRTLKRTDMINPLSAKMDSLSEQEYSDAERWWDRFNVNNRSKNRFCFVGSFMSVFDFSSVRQAAEKFHIQGVDCIFIICGDGGYANEVKNEFSGLPNVLFPGWIDRPKIQYLSLCCSGSIIPYKNIENFTLNTPNKVIDSLSLGLPILTTLSGVVGRMTTDEGVGFSCNNESGLNMHTAMETLLYNPALCSEMSRRAKLLYERDFSFETVYGNLVDRLEVLGGIRA